MLNRDCVNSKSLRRSHYKSESVNGSSTTCLSFCYIQTDITAVLPPGRGVLHEHSSPFLSHVKAQTPPTTDSEDFIGRVTCDRMVNPYGFD